MKERRQHDGNTVLLRDRSKDVANTNGLNVTKLLLERDISGRRLEPGKDQWQEQASILSQDDRLMVLSIS